MKKKQVSKKVLETLVKLKNNGIKICIATGRSPMRIRMSVFGRDVPINREKFGKK